MLPRFCKNCVHFVPNRDIKKAVCTRFNEYDLVSGKIKYDTAYSTRQDPRKCDTHGIYYKPQPKENTYHHFGGGL